MPDKHMNRDLKTTIRSGPMAKTGAEKIRDGLKDTLLGPTQLYEALRARLPRSVSGASV